MQNSLYDENKQFVFYPPYVPCCSGSGKWFFFCSQKRVVETWEQIKMSFNQDELCNIKSLMCSTQSEYTTCKYMDAVIMFICDQKDEAAILKTGQLLLSKIDYKGENLYLYYKNGQSEDNIQGKNYKYKIKKT